MPDETVNGQIETPPAPADAPAEPGETWTDPEPLRMAEPAPERVPEHLLNQLRTLDREIAATRQRQNLLVQGYMAGRGYHPEHDHLNIDLDTGNVTVTPA